MAPPSRVPWHHYAHVLSAVPPCLSSQVLIEGMRRLGAVLRRQHAAATEAAAQAAAAARAAAAAEAEAARQRAASAAAHARA